MFLALGRTSPRDDADTLEHFCGRIFIFGPDALLSDDLITACKAFQTKLIHKHGTASADADIQDICTDFDAAYDNLLAVALSQAYLVTARFRLARDGETEIRVPRDAHYILKNDGSLVSKQSALANQCFYFLKDIAHTHQHHTSGTDRIASVTRISDEKGSAWQRETIYAMMRKVITYRQNSHNIPALYESIGVLAYARAFDRLVRKPDVDDGDIPKYNFDEMHMSLNNKIAKISFERQEAREKIRDIRTAIGFLFAIFVIIFQASSFMYNEEVYVNDYIYNILGIIQEYFAYILMILAYCYFIYPKNRIKWEANLYKGLIPAFSFTVILRQFEAVLLVLVAAILATVYLIANAIGSIG